MHIIGYTVSQIDYTLWRSCFTVVISVYIPGEIGREREMEKEREMERERDREREFGVLCCGCVLIHFERYIFNVFLLAGGSW